MKKFLLVLALLLAAAIYGLRFAWDPILEGWVPCPALLRGWMASLSAPKAYWDDLVRLDIPSGEDAASTSMEITHRYAGRYEAGFILGRNPQETSTVIQSFHGTIRCVVKSGDRRLLTLTSTPGIRTRYYPAGGVYPQPRDVMLGYAVPEQVPRGVPVTLELYVERASGDYARAYGPLQCFVRKQLER